MQYLFMTDNYTYLSGAATPIARMTGLPGGKRLQLNRKIRRVKRTGGAYSNRRVLSKIEERDANRLSIGC
ncbi:MAG TPA: hypothetical protein VGZ01_12760 [Trinickia sp.]|jgi:hypothetical protein|nr:hypothetical protein [Trinickia sp.]